MLFTSSSYTKLVHCASAFQIMIQPLCYTGVLIPLVPYAMIQTIEAPTYYIMGCHRSCLSASINFQQSDLVVDLDTLDIINDTTKERNAQDIEAYTKKVSKVVGGFCCSIDNTASLNHPNEQEKEFRLLWRSWVINLCSNMDKKNKFMESFLKTSMCQQFLLSEQSIVPKKIVQLHFKYLFSHTLDECSQEQFMQMLEVANSAKNALLQLQDLRDLDMTFYLALCQHIWTFYDEYNPVLDFDDCSITLQSLLQSKSGASLISAKVEEIINHLSDVDKSKLEYWDLPPQLKLKLDKYTKRRSTQLLRKSLYLQKSTPAILGNISILSDLTKAFQFDQANSSLQSLHQSSQQLTHQNSHNHLQTLDFMILNEPKEPNELPLMQISEKDLVRSSCELLNQLIAAYYEICTLMYRSEKKEPICKCISDRKKIATLKKTDAYLDFTNVLQLISMYSLNGLTTDAGKLCFWMNIRHTLLYFLLI